MGKVILNPYQSVNWQQQYKANIHTHTTESDGYVYGSEMIKFYKDANYDILFLTDHDSWGGGVRSPREFYGETSHVTFPWSAFEGGETLSYPEGLSYPDKKTFTQPPNGYYNYDEATGIVSFPDGQRIATTKGMEMSFNHHIGVLFNPVGIGQNENREQAVLQKAIETDSIVVMNHPARYWGTSYYTDDWYKDLFRNFGSDNLVGIEIYNESNNYSGYNEKARVLWDMLLSEFMPNRTVWGFSADDSHFDSHVYFGYQQFLLNDLHQTDIKNAMISGTSYSSVETYGTGQAKAPRIDNISVNSGNKTVSIVTPNVTNIVWYSGVEHGESKIVGYGNDFDFEGFGGNYVRAELSNDYGTTWTQPFGMEPSDNPVRFPKNPPAEIDKLIEESYVFDEQWRRIENIYTKDNVGWKKTDFSNYL